MGGCLFCVRLCLLSLTICVTFMLFYSMMRVYSQIGFCARVCAYSAAEAAGIEQPSHINKEDLAKKFAAIVPHFWDHAAEFGLFPCMGEVFKLYLLWGFALRMHAIGVPVDIPSKKEWGLSDDSAHQQGGSDETVSFSAGECSASFMEAMSEESSGSGSCGGDTAVIEPVGAGEEPHQEL